MFGTSTKPHSLTFVHFNDDDNDTWQWHDDGTKAGNDEDNGPDNANGIVWALGMFFSFLIDFLLKSFLFYLVALLHNDDDDNDNKSHNNDDESHDNDDESHDNDDDDDESHNDGPTLATNASRWGHFFSIMTRQRRPHPRYKRESVGLILFTISPCHRLPRHHHNHHHHHPGSGTSSSKSSRSRSSRSRSRAAGLATEAAGAAETTNANGLKTLLRLELWYIFISFFRFFKNILTKFFRSHFTWTTTTNERSCRRRTTAAAAADDGDGDDGRRTTATTDDSDDGRQLQQLQTTATTDDSCSSYRRRWRRTTAAAAADDDDDDSRQPTADRREWPKRMSFGPTVVYFFLIFS
jgi:hypothetical protein